MAFRPTSRWWPRAVRTRSERADAVGAEALAYLNNLYSLALKLTRNPAAAEDLVQETYLKAVRFAPKFTPGTNLKAWLFTILHNTFRNDLRGAGRNPVDVDSDIVEAAALSPAQDDPEQRLLHAVMDADLQAALDALPEVYRQAVWLRDVEECTYQEIAEMLGVRPGTVMSRIARGRRLLHDQVVAARRRAVAGATAGPAASQ